MCREWARLQDQNIHQIDAATNSTSGLLWTTSMITTIWRQYFDMCDLCNAAVHGSDLKTRDIARRRKLTIALCHLHKKRDTVLHTNKDVFLVPTPKALDQYIQRSTVHHLENWLCIWKPVITDSVRTTATLAIQ
jgi:hypothetical protein